jgi:hypothetical protein
LHCRDNDVNHVSLGDCYFILKYFDTNGDRSLSYTEFLQVMLPCDDMYLRSSATQRPNYPVGRYDRLPYSVEKELASLLEKEVHYHTRLERLKHELTTRYDWSNLAAYDKIDSLREGRLNHKNLASFLRLNGYYATEREIIAMIRRMDIDADQQIDFNEWCDAVKPQTDDYSSAHDINAYRPTYKPSESLRASSPLRGSPSRGGSTYQPAATTQSFGQREEEKSSYQPASSQGAFSIS